MERICDDEKDTPDSGLRSGGAPGLYADRDDRCIVVREEGVTNPVSYMLSKTVHYVNSAGEASRPGHDSPWETGARLLRS